MKKPGAAATAVRPENGEQAMHYFANEYQAASTTEPVPPPSVPPARPAPWFRCCRCGRMHKTWRTLAECKWKSAIWVAGQGPVGLLAPCGHGLTVTLWEDGDYDKM